MGGHSFFIGLLCVAYVEFACNFARSFVDYARGSTFSFVRAGVINSATGVTVARFFLVVK